MPCTIDLIRSSFSPGFQCSSGQPLGFDGKLLFCRGLERGGGGRGGGGGGAVKGGGDRAMMKVSLFLISKFRQVYVCHTVTCT